MPESPPIIRTTFTAAVRQLRGRITGVLHRARAVDLTSCEDHPIALLLEDRRPRIRSVLLDGVELASIAERLTDSEEETATSGVIELAPFVRVELSAKLERVTSLGQELEPWEIGAELASARRRVIRSLTALELSAADECGDHPQHTNADDLDASIRTRKTLAFFRRRIEGLGEPNNDALESVVRTAGIEVARMVCSETFADLRVRDRVQARRLQQRIMSWLRGGSRDQRWIVDGRRLLEDVAAFAALGAAVSQREELVQHDLGLIRAALSEMARGGPVPPIWHHRLRALEGRSDELDVLLAQAGPLDAALVSSTLFNIRKTLPGESLEALDESIENAE